MSGEQKRGRPGGDPMTPEGATPRPTTQKRGGEIMPERTQARKTGDPMTNTQQSAFVPRVIVGPTGDSKSTVNPVK